MDPKKTIGVGMLGYAFMGKAHTNAFKKLPYFYYPHDAEPVLEGICGRNQQAVQEAAQRFGYRYGTTDWKKLIDDPAIEIFDNNGPNNVHKDPCIAALQAGKHTIVEKPLALDVDEARAMVEAAQEADKHGIKSMVSFSNRFSPAVLLAKRLIQEGKIGQVYHFRAAFLQDWLLDPNFPLAWRLKKEVAGSGVLGDLNAHSIDMARFLTGLEISEACGVTETFVKERPVPLEASGLSGKAGAE
jgi:predicted dehydrogenase